jgi:Undecaprenyl-phosphate glucose phosphotransferase
MSSVTSPVYSRAASLSRLKGSAAPQSVAAQHLSKLVLWVVGIEFIVVALTAFIASLIYNLLVLSQWPPTEQYVPAALGIATLIVLFSTVGRQYRTLQKQSRHRFLWNGLGAVALAFSFFLSILFLFKVAEWYSRGTFIIQFFSVGIALLVTRAATHAWAQSAIASGRIPARRAVVIGDAIHFSQIANDLTEANINTVGSLPLTRLNENLIKLSGGDASDHRQTIEACRSLSPDDVLILAKPTDLPEVARLAHLLSELPVFVYVLPVETGDLFWSARFSEVGKMTMVQVLQPPLTGFDWLTKRAFDMLSAATGLVIFAPLFLFLSTAIKLESRGPIFFRQPRHGYNNEIIHVLKFRTMTTIEDGLHFTQAKRNDPRVTPLGRLLRANNLDELPQLFNVLIGEMSLVGPRPHPIALNQSFEREIWPLSRRHKVKPGITGWAQVNGYRGETDTLEKMQRRFEHDLYYIENWSFLFDLKIILMTLFSRKAYTNAS